LHTPSLSFRSYVIMRSWLQVSSNRITDQTLEIASCIVVDGEDSDDCIVVEVEPGV